MLFTKYFNMHTNSRYTTDFFKISFQKEFQKLNIYIFVDIGD